MKHFTEADLLETYYTQPGQSMPVMMHLADCDECAARYEKLEKKLRGLHACAHEKEETFWTRQRMSIMQRIANTRRVHVPRLAAAAALAIALGAGIYSWQHEKTPPPDAAIGAETSPWESEELDDYAAIVEWESWLGDQS